MTWVMIVCKHLYHANFVQICAKFRNINEQKYQNALGIMALGTMALGILS